MVDEHAGEIAGAPAPYLSDVPVRLPIDEGDPSLDAGLSWSSAADRVASYAHAAASRRRRARSWWRGPETDELRLRQRAEACRALAPRLDRLGARGWIVWHDRLVPGSRNVIDHLLIGPGGVVALQSIPVYDHVQVAGATLPGDVTTTALAQSMDLLRRQVVEPLEVAIATLMPGWTVPAYGHNVLVGGRVGGSYDNSIRPDGIADYLTTLGSPFSPTHVHDIALSIEPLLVLAPLVG